MVDMKQDDARNGQTPIQEDNGAGVNFENESSEDNSSNHESVDRSSVEENIDFQKPRTDDVSSDAQIGSKRALSKQPSNGIHVLQPEGLPSNQAPPYSNPDTPARAAHDAGKDQSEEITFDPNGSYYMANACCELVHYRTAAILVGMAELALIVVWGVLIGREYVAHGGFYNTGSKISLSVQGGLAAGCMIIIILMFIGVMSERPLLLWPHMIVQIIGISLGIGLTVVAVIAMCAGTSLAETIFSGIFGNENLPKVEKTLGPIWPFCLAVVFDFGAALGIWFYIVVKGCYEYLMDKVFFEKHLTAVHSLSLKKENLGVSLKKQS